MLVFMDVTGEGEGSGVPAEMSNAHEVTITDGIVVHLKVYTDRNEALGGDGLRE
jgi:hypothetical protein